MKLCHSFVRCLLMGLALGGIVACGKKQEVAGPKYSGSHNVNDVIQHVKSACSQHTIIKPKVDILLLFDNSTSSNFINEETKTGLANTIGLISPRFDYHIVITPLLGNSSSPLWLMVENTTGLDAAAQSKIIPNDNFRTKIDTFPKVQGSLESGLLRTIDLLKTNQTNGIFRKSGFTMVVLMSNGDDNSVVGQNTSPLAQQTQFNARVNELNTEVQKLTPMQFRFISVVAQSASNSPTTPCPKEGFKIGYWYRKMSQEFFSKLPSGATTPFEQTYQDSYDICTTAYNHIFDGANQTIQDVIVKHVYNHWPLASSQDPNFNPKKIQVWKNGTEVLAEGDPNGFNYIGFKTNWNTRILPSPGEPFTGHLIELLGTGKVTFPECLRVKTEEPADFYGYIVLDKNPNQETVEITINGQKIANNASNGWTFDNYHVSKNIRVKSKTDLSPFVPGENKSGYFIKLHGNAVYSNGDEVSFSYRPAGL